LFNSPDQSNARPANRLLSDFTKINLVFWVVIALINYFQDVYLLSIQENDNAWTFAAIFSFDWPLWAALTPFIVKLAIRYPMTWSSMYKTLSRQFALATFFVALHAVVEFLIIGFLISDLLARHAEDVYLPDYFMASIHSRYIVYFLIVGGVQRFELYYRYQQSEVEASRLKEQLSAARLETLRMQLQPHFLFNTHHTISGLILKNENNRAIQMIARLSDLLRKSLEKSKTDFIPLYQELEMVSSYMDIQQVRFRERLKFFLQVDPEVNDVLVPSFFLQPLIENAVMHGIEPSHENGEIRLSISKTEDNRLSICLEDNGVGVSKAGSEGIGLSNTKSRLEQLYKGHYLFTIQPITENKGTRINIEVPLNPMM
jgi:two-component system, LytTR family, sensor kinase